MEFLDKLTKKASETYKGAAEKTSKIAKETKLKIKINENKSKINDLYQEIGKKVYQKHTSSDDICVKKDIEEECAKIDILSTEIEKYHKEILELSNMKPCIKCKEPMAKEAKFCPKCGEEQPLEDKQEVFEVEVVSENCDPVWDGKKEDCPKENYKTDEIKTEEKNEEEVDKKKSQEENKK